MAIVKEIKNSNFGIVKVALSSDDKMLYCLQDLCKLMGLNINNIIALLGNDKIVYLNYVVKNKRTRKAFIDSEGLDFCVRTSEDPKADYIGVWLKKLEKNSTLMFQELLPNDLKDLSVAGRVLDRLAELERLVSVLSFKSEEDAEKIAFVDSLYGTRVPIDLTLVPGRIKFRNIGYKTIVEDLRTAGIFNERNQPNQKYVDEGYFRFITVTTMIGTTEVVMTKILVYNKGIKLIESIIKKRVGNVETRKNTKVLYH